MADEKSDLHYKLLAEISEYMNHDVGNLDKFKVKLRKFLKPVDVAPKRDIHEVFTAMESRGFLDVGEYSHLKSVLRGDHQNIINMIEETEKEMGIVISEDGNKPSSSWSVEKDEAQRQNDPAGIHCELIAEIQDYLSKELGNVEKFKTKLKSKLTPQQLSQDKDFYDIAKTMESKGLLKVGYYDHLIDALKGDQEDIVKMIRKAEKKIKEIKENQKNIEDKESNKRQKNQQNTEDKESNKREKDYSSVTDSPKRRKNNPNDDGGSDTVVIQDKALEANVHKKSESPGGENFRKIEESALPYEEIYNIVHGGVCDQIGNIHISGNNFVKDSQGTGFRVGDDLVMSAYHVFKQKLDFTWWEIAGIIYRKLDKGKDLKHYSASLMAYLNVTCDQQTVTDKEELTRKCLDTWRISTSPQRTFGHLIHLFEEEEHKTLPQDIRKYVEKNSNIGSITFGQFKKNGENEVTFMLKLDVPFYNEADDVILLRLVKDENKQIPKPFKLETSVASTMHLIGHPDNKLLQFDSGCQVYTDHDQQKLEQDVQEAMDYCLPKCKDDHSKVILQNDYNKVINKYKDCKNVIFHSSRTIAHGASGSPGIVMDRSVPKVQAMLQSGHPGIVYRALSKDDIKNLPARCLFESGLSMKRLKDILMTSEETKHIGEDIFKSSDTTEAKEIELNDVTKAMEIEVGGNQAHS